jgi:hypothetical protein
VNNQQVKLITRCGCSKLMMAKRGDEYIQVPMNPSRDQWMKGMFDDPSNLSDKVEIERRTFKFSHYERRMPIFIEV